MEAIATLVQNDPYLQLSLRDRVAARRDRRSKFFSQVPSIILKPSAPKKMHIKIREVKVTKTSIPVVPCSGEIVFLSRSGIPESPEVVRRARVLNVDLIQREVADAFNLSRADMISERRTKNIVLPRQIAMYLARTMTPRSMPDIGRRFGNRDHTTILHAISKVSRLIETDLEFRGKVDAIKELIAEATA